MKKYFYILNGQQIGPLSIEELKANNITRETMIWCEGMGDWEQAGKIAELSSLFGDLPPSLPTNLAQTNPQNYNSPQQNAGYQNPTPQYGNPNPTQDQLSITNGVPPKTWLVESILVTLFCCLPFGIAGIVNASKVESAFYAGDIFGAQHASDQAAKWTKWGFFSSIIAIGLYLLFVAIFIGGASSGVFR
jgi:Interferon-induced transmembrane protein/GYF domain 2